MLGDPLCAFGLVRRMLISRFEGSDGSLMAIDESEVYQGL